MPRDCKTGRCLPIWPIAARICARWLQQEISALSYVCVAESILMPPDVRPQGVVLAEAHIGGGGGLLEENCWRRTAGGELLEEDCWRRTRGGVGRPNRDGE